MASRNALKRAINYDDNVQRIKEQMRSITWSIESFTVRIRSLAQHWIHIHLVQVETMLAIEFTLDVRYYAGMIKYTQIDTR
jgi:hypothetical protein